MAPAQKLWFAGVIYLLAVCGTTRLAAWEGHIGSGKSMKSIRWVLWADILGDSRTDLNLMALGLPQKGTFVADVAGHRQPLQR